MNLVAVQARVFRHRAVRQLLAWIDLASVDPGVAPRMRTVLPTMHLVTRRTDGTVSIGDPEKISFGVVVWIVARRAVHLAVPTQRKITCDQLGHSQLRIGKGADADDS